MKFITFLLEKTCMSVTTFIEIHVRVFGRLLIVVHRHLEAHLS